MAGKHHIKKLRMFLDAERTHEQMYKYFELREAHPKHKRVLNKIYGEEKKHKQLLTDILQEEGISTRPSMLIPLKVVFYKFISQLFGMSFGIAAIERSEDGVIRKYLEVLEKIRKKKHANRIKEIISDEKNGEEALQQSLEDYSEHFDYIKSIIFGLNDGLVEILAVVAGLAVVATSPIVVVIGGLIVGISGTLSMAGGAYLSSKSYNLYEEKKSEGKKKPEPINTAPIKDAMYTGIFYFIGSLVSVVPFAFGIEGFSGILASIIAVSISLVIASSIIGVVSRTSIRRRSLEMLTISLGAAFVTIILGIILRSYGIAI